MRPNPRPASRRGSTSLFVFRSRTFAGTIPIVHRILDRAKADTQNIGTASSPPPADTQVDESPATQGLSTGDRHLLPDAFPPAPAFLCQSLRSSRRRAGRRGTILLRLEQSEDLWPPVFRPGLRVAHGLPSFSFSGSGSVYVQPSIRRSSPEYSDDGCGRLAAGTAAGVGAGVAGGACACAASAKTASRHADVAFLNDMAKYS